MGIDRREIAAVFAGGVLGAIARAELAEALPAGAGHWPWATLLANIAGALVLGYVATLLTVRSDLRHRFLGTGFCGALTTFSTLQIELLRMLDAGHHALAAGYALVTLAGGLAAVALGGAVARAHTGAAPTPA